MAPAQLLLSEDGGDRHHRFPLHHLLLRAGLQELPGDLRKENIGEQILLALSQIADLLPGLFELRLKSIRRPRAYHLATVLDLFSNRIINRCRWRPVTSEDVPPHFLAHLLVTPACKHVANSLAAYDLARGGNQWRIAEVSANSRYLLKNSSQLVQRPLLPQLGH